MRPHADASPRSNCATWSESAFSARVWRAPSGESDPRRGVCLALGALSYLDHERRNAEKLTKWNLNKRSTHNHRVVDYPLVRDHRDRSVAGNPRSISLLTRSTAPPGKRGKTHPRGEDALIPPLKQTKELFDSINQVPINKGGKRRGGAPLNHLSSSNSQ